ncbi:MAG: O-antigen ligase family protein [Geobacter sp.]|nr:O-antigen ligase family protein [Geobacter sp.]
MSNTIAIAARPVKKGLLTEHVALCFLCVLVLILPVAHTAAIRTLCTVVLLSMLVWRGISSKDLQWHSTGFEWPFVAFLLVALASLPTSVDLGESLKEIKGELIVPILLFYVAYFTLKREEDGLLLLLTLFFGSFVFSAYSFYDFYNHNGDWFSADTYRAGGLRDPGGGEAAGLYHIMVIPFLFWGMFYFKKIWQRLGLTVLLCLNLLALHITFTRAAFIALGLQLIVIAALLILEKRWLAGLVLLCLLLSGGGFYLEKKMFREMHTSKLPGFAEFFNMTPDQLAGPAPDPGSTRKRLAMWKTAVDRIAENPFMPHGYGRFLFGREVRTEKNARYIYDQTHNSFLDVFFELGIQGMLVFLWMIGTFFRAFWKFWRNAENRTSRYLAAGLLTMMVGYWVNNFFGSFDGDDAKLLFMVLLGVGMAVMHRMPAEQAGLGKAS